MQLTNNTKEKILSEYNQFKDSMYAGKTLEQRQALDAFYTPAELTIQMIEKFDCDDLADKKILDPCCGSGNLLAACIIAGANPRNIYGNEFDPDMVVACKQRLNKVCEDRGLELIPENNIHEGNALHDFCLNVFEDCYNDCYFHDRRKSHDTIKNDEGASENAWNQYRKYNPQGWAIYDETKRQRALELACIPKVTQNDEEVLW